jgi:hypothetical protein
MPKRRPPEHKQIMPERKPEPAPEPLAADRQNEEDSPNNFAFSTMAALIVVIVLIVVLYVTGVIKP